MRPGPYVRLLTESRPLTLGTAGHIDHGKTALVEALTGVNTDRLPDERKRGISIELGFAQLVLPSGRRASVVDVPGHERLVKTMVAGATGIDFFLLVVAADDGVMPQTIEHVAVLRAVGVERGVVAITKIDMDTAQAPSSLAPEIAKLLPDAALVAVSALTGEGLNDLLVELENAAHSVDQSPRRFDGEPVLHVDRSFTLRGIGTVVTGTLQHGPLAKGETVNVRPGERSARVRSIQVHGKSVSWVAAGQRVALNLGGIRHHEISMGDVVTGSQVPLEESYRLDVHLALEPDADHVLGERVQVHHGTRDVAARVIALPDDGFAQLRLEAPLAAFAGDRVVLRQIAHPSTLGGAEVVDPRPARHGSGLSPAALERLRNNSSADEPERPSAVDPKQAEEPPRLGRLDHMLQAVLDGDGLEPRSPRMIAEKLRLKDAQVATALSKLVAAGQATRVAPRVYYSTAELEKAVSRVSELLREQGELSVSELRDSLGTSRKYAQALLEHLDAVRITIRIEDRHVLRAHNR